MPGLGTQSPDITATMTPLPVAVDNRQFVPMLEFGKGRPLEGNFFFTPKADIYGDLHGNTQVDLNKNPDRLKVIDGDVGDRGKDSWKRIQEVIQRVKDGSALYILGNHDILMMSAMTEDKTGQHRDRDGLLMWLYNGGYITIKGAGVNLGPVEQQIDNIVRGLGGDINDVEKRQEAVQMLFGICFNPPEAQNNPDYQKQMVEYNGKMQILEQLLPTVRANQGLREWNEQAQKNGKMFAFVDGAFVGHSLPPTDQDGHLVDMGKYGKGVDGLINLQKAVAAGDSEAIFFLAHGGENSPVWNRKAALHVIETPGAAHIFREEMNQQLAIATSDRPAVEAKEFIIGHTPVDTIKNQGQQSAGKTQMLGGEIVVIDYGAAMGGNQGVYQIDMDANSGKVEGKLVDAVSNLKLQDASGKVVSRDWEVKDKKFAVVGEPPKPVVDIPLADKAKGELATLLKRPVSWAELRTLDIDTALKPDGELGKAGWKDDAATREYLGNAKARAQELATEGLAKLTAPPIGLTSEEIINKSVDEIAQITATKDNWVVDPNDQKGKDTREYIEVAKSLVQEQKTAEEQKKGQQELLNEIKILSPDSLLSVVAGKALAGLGRLYWEKAQDSIESLRKQGLISEEKATELREAVNNAHKQFDEAMPKIDAQLDALEKSGKFSKKEIEALRADLEIGELKLQKAVEEDPKKKAELEKVIQAKKTARQQIKKEDGTDIPDSLVSAALELTGVKAGSQEAVAIEENPLGAMEVALEKAAIDPKARTELIDRLTKDTKASAEEVKTFEAALDQIKSVHEAFYPKEKSDAAPVESRVRQLAKAGGLLAAIIALLMLLKSVQGER